MNAPAVQYRNSNRFADFYSVATDKLVTVRHGTHPERPWVCLTCITNDCEHIEVVAAYVSAHPRVAA
jgi:hypothetical protein